MADLGIFAVQATSWEERFSRFNLLDTASEQEGGPPGATIIKTLLGHIQSTLHVQKFGCGDVKPDPEMHKYMRGKLEQSTWTLLEVAFNPNHDDVSARCHAIDVLQRLELVPDAVLAAKFANQLVDFMCVEVRFAEYEIHSMYESDGDAISGCHEWLRASLNKLAPDVLVQHVGAFIALLKRGYEDEYDAQAYFVNTALLLFKEMPPSVIAKHASTFLDIIQNERQWGVDACHLYNVIDVMCQMDSTMLGECLERLLLIFKTKEDARDAIWEHRLFHKIEPASVAERAHLVVACVSDADYTSSFSYGDDYDVRRWGIQVLSQISIEKYADVIAALLGDEENTVKIAAMEALSTLSPALLADYSAAIAAHVDNDVDEEVKAAALKAVAKLSPALKALQAATDDTAGKLIQAQMRQIEELKDRIDCVVCMTRQRAILFQPCNHFVVCATCETGDACPVCSRAIENRITIANSS